MSLYVTVPIGTEVIELNPDCAFSTAYEDGVLMITVDTRCQNVHQRLGLSTNGVRTTALRRRSSVRWPGRSAIGC
jgi:hypothetical protein